MATLYTAKFNINEKIYEAKKGTLLVGELLNKVFECFNQNEKVLDEKIEGMTYKFVDLERDYDNQIITGRMIKYYDGTNARYLEDEDKLVEEHTPNKAEYITFSFNTKTEIIGFVPKQGFSKENFIYYFELLIEKMCPEIGKIKLILVIDGAELEHKFKQLKILKEIQIEVIPENNDTFEIGDMLDILKDDIEESNAQHMEVKLKGTKREPLVKKSKLVEDFKGIAKKAYAKLKAIGYKENGDEYTIDTNKDIHLKRTVANHNKDSMPMIKELTQEVSNEYAIQKNQEANRYGGEKK